MAILIWMTAAAAVLFLGWNLFRRFRSDSLNALVEGRRATSQLVGRGELVEGNRHVAVAMAVTPSTLFYENSDMHASIDLAWVRDVEYDTRLVTGAHIDSGKVLRLRSDRQTLEFVIPDDSVSRWRLAVPPGARLAVAAGQP